MKLQRKGEFLSTRVQYIPLGRIRPNPQQPRRSFDEEGLAELAASIRSCGILQPLTVRRAGDGYELVAGERRLRAARIAGLREVPCLVAQVGEEDSALLALMENLQRRDLDCWEEAQAISRLMPRRFCSSTAKFPLIIVSVTAPASRPSLMRKLFFATPLKSPLAPGCPPENRLMRIPFSIPAISSSGLFSPGRRKYAPLWLAARVLPVLRAAYSERQKLSSTPSRRMTPFSLLKPFMSKRSPQTILSSSGQVSSVIPSDATFCPSLSFHMLVSLMRA